MHITDFVLLVGRFFGLQAEKTTDKRRKVPSTRRCTWMSSPSCGWLPMPSARIGCAGAAARRGLWTRTSITFRRPSAQVKGGNLARLLGFV